MLRDIMPQEFIEWVNYRNIDILKIYSFNYKVTFSNDDNYPN
jgi:hypothetical protein